MAPPGGFKLKVGVEGPTMQAFRPEPARRPEAPNPTLLNPCFVSFPASLTRQLLRLVSLFGGDNKSGIRDPPRQGLRRPGTESSLTCWLVPFGCGFASRRPGSYYGETSPERPRSPLRTSPRRPVLTISGPTSTGQCGAKGTVLWHSPSLSTRWPSGTRFSQTCHPVKRMWCLGRPLTMSEPLDRP